MPKPSDVIAPLKREHIFLYFMTSLNYFHRNIYIMVIGIPIWGEGEYSSIGRHQVTVKEKNQKPYGLIAIQFKFV